MIAVFVNCATVIVGSLIGLIFSRKISDELSNIVSAAAGVVSLVIGLQMTFEYNSIIVLTLALIAGGLLGSWWDIDGKILSLGRFLELHFSKNRKIQPENAVKHNFAYAFLNASVLFCVGAMAIVGSFKAGINKDYTLIYTKSILDGFMAIVFAASMGAGTIFAALSILAYQGLLTLSSTWIEPFINQQMLTEISATGGALIVMIGINLLKLRTLKTANYLPAIILAALFVPIASLFGI
ncbi:MAG: DUF554 domain-containing protein [Treponema sp.]|jgi:uncharacterized membrane protein YqgA involved in biofilm formation|nr:DUF554 domain-containing protein [Treponema sp.]